MSSGTDINVDDNSGLIRNNGFIAALIVCGFDADCIDGVPDIDSFISKFESLLSHDFKLCSVRNSEGKNSVRFCPQVSEMWLRNFAVKLIEKVNEFSDTPLLFINNYGNILIVIISTYTFICALRGVIFLSCNSGFSGNASSIWLPFIFTALASLIIVWTGTSRFPCS